MASGSNSSSSESPSRISETDSEIYDLSDNEVQNGKLTIRSNALDAGGDDWSDEDSGSDESVPENGKQLCIGRRNDVISWGSREEIGSRDYMEDRIAILPEIVSLKCDDFGGCTAPDCEFASVESPIHYFAVFDGHGGSEVSDYCANSLHEALKEAWVTERNENDWNTKWQSALFRAYESVNNACVNLKKYEGGSTAVVVLVSSCQIVAANCGDSRAVLSRGSHTIPLTTDHKPYRQDEQERIIQSGGFVIPDRRGVMRVDGFLAMTRAIGDLSMKPHVSAVPELTFTTRTEEDECLIIASDGLWDVMSTEYVGFMAAKLLKYERKFPTTNESATKVVADYLYREAYLRSNTDNFSVIVVDLKMQP